jgi:hypothetical protein
MAGTCLQWGRKKYGASKKGSEEWGRCDPDIEIYLTKMAEIRNYESIWKKVPENFRISEGQTITKSLYIDILDKYNLKPMYIGAVEIEGNKKQFKIFDFKNETKKSKRTEARGRVCSFHNVPFLRKVLHSLENDAYTIKGVTIPEKEGKLFRNKICIRLEFLFRLLNKNKKETWFYYGYFQE